MAYRRRQGISRTSTFKEEIYGPPFDSNDDPLFSSSSSFSLSSSSSSSSSLAAQAIRASAAHRESSLPSAYASDNLRFKSFAAYEENSLDNESKSGFWGLLARKAKAIIEDDDIAQQYETRSRTRFQSAECQLQYPSLENSRKMDNPTVWKGLDAITSSLNQLGDTFGKAFEEGRTIVENKTADIIQETRKLQIKRKGNNNETPPQSPEVNGSWQPLHPQIQTNHETQLKASRDVALATAAKAKLLLRELKTVKADLAFAKERCAQLEEENKILRENREKGDNRADDDLIRLQLETLLAEKARLAHENSIYARENRFLREIVEFHQLTMQDIVYLDEGMEEVTEVYSTISSPGVSSLISSSPRSPTSPSSSSLVPPPSGTDHPPETSEIFPFVCLSEEAIEAASEDEVLPTTSVPEKDTKTSLASSA